MKTLILAFMLVVVGANVATVNAAAPTTWDRRN